ncbi:hypothetical protein MKX01_030105 [Papaver californicum]|nr:hypothetical protein MKX01_030105 [Papaver californicum]
MESSGGGIRRVQVVAMPYPGRGHINAMMNFCKHLTAKFPVEDDIRIYFVVTEEWLGFLESSSESRLPPQIQLRSIPNVIPSELVRGLDHNGFFQAVQAKMEDPFEQFLDQLQEEGDPGVVVTTIIGDTVLPIPVVLLWPMSPSVFSTIYHTDLLAQNDYFPGVSPIILADMPATIDRSRKRSFTLAKAVSAVCKTQCLLLTTYYELEPQVTKALMDVLPVPVYPVGPSIPLPTTVGDDHDNMDSSEYYYLKWLDAQPKSSVLYVSFVSFLSAFCGQMEEILAGLRESGVRYLLVSRGGRDRINNNEMDNSQSLVVPWCDQLRVLCHSSVGGFWTHCGWNSTLEGVYAGVPMLTYPVGFDQITNRTLIVDCCRIGMKVVCFRNSSANKDRNELLTALQIAPPATYTTSGKM